MSGNDVAFVGALAALGAAVATPTAAWLVARLQAQTARDEREHASSLEAYDEAMTLAFHMQATAVLQTKAFDGIPELPGTKLDLPGSSAILQSVARVEVRGSSTVAEALQAAALASQEFATLVSELQSAGRRDDAARQLVHDAQDLVTQRRRELGEAIRADIRRR